jgi:protocatechuate 3,4-dioxygenase beta subunit
MENPTRRNFIHSALLGTLAISSARPLLADTLLTDNRVCALTPEQEEGPFYIPDEAMRSDLVEDRIGVPLTLELRLSDIKRCAPLQDATLEIWSCDALGQYAGYSGAMLGAMGGMPPPDAAHQGAPAGRPPKFPAGFQPPHQKPTDQKTFLRGIQRVDNQGRVAFKTIYPGCYAGRVNHIHVKVRLDGASGHGGRVVHTGQILFPEQISTAILATAPYSTNHVRRTTLDEDPVYTDQHGSEVIATVLPIKPGSLAAGYLATISFGIDPDATL